MTIMSFDFLYCMDMYSECIMSFKLLCTVCLATYVTEFWKITLMGVPEIIRFLCSLGGY